MNCVTGVARIRVCALALASSVLLGWLLEHATPAHALISIITVNTLADNNNHGDGKCTLREAVDNANNHPSDVTSGDCAAGDTLNNIQFSVGGTITLTGVAGGALPVNSLISIDGANAITLSGGGVLRLFILNPNVSLTLNNLVLSDGNAGGSVGGSIYSNQARLSLQHVTIQRSHTNNFAGGAIFMSGGTLSLNDSIVQDSSGFNFGAINSTGPVTIVNSILRDNVATLGGGALSVGNWTSIKGSTLSGNQVTNGDGGAIYATAVSTVTIESSVLLSNKANGSGVRGGAIFNLGTVVISQTLLSGNTVSGSGGAVWSNNGVTFSFATVSDNSASLDGGGVLSTEFLRIDDSTFSGNSAINGGGVRNDFFFDGARDVFVGNHAQNNGGAIWTDSSTFLESTVVRDNSAQVLGGGIHVDHNYVSLVNTTLSNNHARTAGGIYNFGNLTLGNVTMSSNRADTYAGGLLNSATAELRSATLSGNSAPTGGGALYTASGATTTLTNTIVANSPTGGNCSGVVMWSRNSIDSDNSCGLSGPGDQHVDPQLTALGNYGGPLVGTDAEPLLVHMPKSISPAIDGASNLDAFSNDERGKQRPSLGGGYDIGAVERQPNDTDLAPHLYLPAVKR